MLLTAFLIFPIRKAKYKFLMQKNEKVILIDLHLCPSILLAGYELI